MKEFVDFSVFMGMHSDSDDVRIACKNFFVSRLKKQVFMSLENVGKCDAIAWTFPREVQDAYYPFMDTLHSVMRISRIGYSEKDLHTELKDLRTLSLQDKLSIAMATNAAGVLYSVRKELREVGPPIRMPDNGTEKKFPAKLETLYQHSLHLRLNLNKFE